eukprot:GHVT01073089.1.p1 GENE.GHVT01073089.1~~GHVT01073089.1.p1  ORF type:complete len:409 (+),score=60.94 GHVT01073089.1:348-1574(+)
MHLVCRPVRRLAPGLCGWVIRPSASSACTGPRSWQGFSSSLSPGCRLGGNPTRVLSAIQAQTPVKAAQVGRASFGVSSRLSFFLFFACLLAPLAFCRPQGFARPVASAAAEAWPAGSIGELGGVLSGGALATAWPAPGCNRRANAGDYAAQGRRLTPLQRLKGRERGGTRGGAAKPRAPNGPNRVVAKAADLKMTGDVLPSDSSRQCAQSSCCSLPSSVSVHPSNSSRVPSHLRAIESAVERRGIGRPNHLPRGLGFGTGVGGTRRRPSKVGRYAIKTLPPLAAVAAVGTLLLTAHVTAGSSADKRAKTALAGEAAETDAEPNARTPAHTTPSLAAGAEDQYDNTLLVHWNESVQELQAPLPLQPPLACLPTRAACCTDAGNVFVKQVINLPFTILSILSLLVFAKVF